MTTDVEPFEQEFECLGGAHLEPPKWVIEGLLPTGITFLAGPPKSQKSTLSLAMALAASGHKVDRLKIEWTAKRTGRVMGWSAEASAGELRHMARTGLGVEVRNDGSILVHKNPFQYRLDDIDAVETMLDWLEQYQPRLFFIDPLRDFHALDEKDDGAMNRLLRPFQKWAKDHDAACLIVHHARKRSELTGKVFGPEDMRGSSAMFGLADAILMTTPQGKLGTTISATFKRGQSWEATIKLADWEAREEEAVQVDDVTFKVYRALRYGAENMRSIAKQIATRHATVLDSLGRLKTLGVVRVNGKGLEVEDRDEEMKQLHDDWRTAHAGQEKRQGKEKRPPRTSGVR